MHTPAGRWIQATSLRFSQCFRAHTRGLARGSSFPSLVSHLCTSLFSKPFSSRSAPNAHTLTASPLNCRQGTQKSTLSPPHPEAGQNWKPGIWDVPVGRVSTQVAWCCALTDLTQIDTPLIQGQVFASAFTSPKVTCRVRSLRLFLPSTSRLSSSKVLSSFPQTSPIQVPGTDPQRSELWSFQALSPSGALGLGDGGRPDLEEGSRRR